MRGWCLAVIALVLHGANVAQAAPLDMKSVNEAQFTDKRGKGASPIMLKLQVLLARVHFSPGLIDGRDGENVRKALAAFSKANDLKGGGKLDKELFDKLAGTSGEPVLREYTITEADVKGPFVERIPAKMEEMAALERMAYRNALEGLAEKFHMDEGLLKALNQGKAFDSAGATIMVANVKDERPKEKVGKIVVEKPARALRALDGDGKLLSYYPASIGSQEKPAPSGTLTVDRVAENPSYTYNPKYKFKGVKSDKPFTIKPGPNNPVGGGLDRPFARKLRHSRHARSRKGRQELFAWLRADDELGREAACPGSRERHASGVRGLTAARKGITSGRCLF